MVAKEFLSRVIEDFVGEFILNISKEKLKLALVRGKLKVEDVELDGDLIGSHILGAAVGLSGFGVLSCYAREARLSVPWKSLEKEPTRIEFDDIHLLCIPLLPSTANRMYGAGTPTDPRCSLRTRAKRSSLARLERNFFSRRIPGEGPPDPRIVRASKREKKIRKKGKRSLSLGSPTKGVPISKKNINRTTISDSSDEDINYLLDEEEGNVNEMNSQEQKNWRVKLRTKLFRNIDIKLKNIHIRCEVPEGSLGIGHTHEAKIKKRNKNKHPNLNLNTTERAFAFGLTVGSFIYKSANKNWETGHINWDIDDLSGEKAKKEGTYDTNSGSKRYKVADTHNMSFYWDDDPPVLLSECHILKANPNTHSLSPRKVQTQISNAMKMMIHQQDPGSDIKESLENSDERWDKKERISRVQTISEKRHDYIIEPSSPTIRLCFSNIDSPLPPSCFIELLACKFKLSLRPSQHQQYKRLRDAMFTQQRIDTMLHQRPSKRPNDDPRSWWNYIISCVVTCPHSRPWRDVLIICKSRSRYMELVEKKLIHSSEDTGFHEGLTESEKSELLRLEDLLPIEALLSFHLVSLRKVLKRGLSTNGSKKKPSKSLLRSLSLKGRRNVDSSENNLDSNFTQLLDDKQEEFFENPKLSKGTSICKEPMEFSFQAHKIEASLKLLDGFSYSPIIIADIHTCGHSRITGDGRTSLLLDLQKIDVLGCQTLFHPIKYTRVLTVRGLNDSKLNFEQKRNYPVNLHSEQGEKTTEDWLTSSYDSDSLPIRTPDGVVCRLMISLSPGAICSNIASHPATITWNKTCFEAFAAFFQSPAPEMKSVLKGQLRDTATPLAHRAQLALTSPMSISLTMNVDAPKFLIPVSEKGSDGALFIDAGRFLVSFKKKEQVTATHWEVEGYNLQVKFVKASFPSAVDDIERILYCQSRKNEISTVISPFSVRLVADLVGEKELGHAIYKNIDYTKSTEIQSKDVRQRVICDIGKISLNLVNVEVLAKAIGKYYAAQILRVKHLNETNQRKKLFNARQEKDNRQPLHSEIKVTNHDPEKKNLIYFTMSLEKIEMILEGHSKVESKCTTKQNRKVEKELLQCKYIIEVFGVKMHREVEDATIRTNVLVQDISIRNLSLPPIRGQIVTASPFHQKEDLNASHRETGKCEHNTNMTPKNSDNSCRSPIISFVHLHYGQDHVNEVEVDIDSLIIRITLTTLKDCMQAVKRIMELIELSTKAMERRTHSNVRAQRTSGDFPDKKPHLWENLESASFDSSFRQSRKENLNDSLLLLKIKLKNAFILVGTYQFSTEPDSSVFVFTEDKVGAAQLCTNALIMFQSVENPDSSGMRTLHISVDNLSTSLIEQLDPLRINECSPILGPLSAEFRAVYTTENFGDLLFQDFSIGSNCINFCMAPNDFRFLKILIANITSALQTLSHEGSNNSTKTFSQNSWSRFGMPVRIYREKGAGIATAIRLELDSFSFVVLRHYKEAVGTKPLFELTANQTKARFDGLISALAGDLTSTVAINFFNIEASDWDFVIEPFDILLQADQLPNELNMGLTTSKLINMNVTSAFLRDLSEFITLNAKYSSKFVEDKFTNHVRQQPAMASVTPVSDFTSLNTLYSVSIINESGIDLLIRSSNSSLKQIGKTQCSNHNSYYLLKEGSQLLFASSANNDYRYNNKSDVSSYDSHSFDLKLSSREEVHLGEREAIIGLSFLKNSSVSATTHISRYKNDAIDSNYDFMEPVVEFCMQNQRLRAGMADIYSLQNGQDLLSSILWSPSDDILVPPSKISNNYHDTASVDGNWLRPYLSEDPPEWTDMTGVLRKEREDIILPNKKWIWASDWTVDISGIYGKTTDSDGWEYATDFETFNSVRRFYQRGDNCRRRRWTRIRFFLPSLFESLQRPLHFVWHPSRDENGNYCVTIKSRITIHNHTNVKLSIFAFHLRWDKDKIAGSFLPGEKIHVPVSMSPLSHITLAIRRDTSDNILCHRNDIELYHTSERLMILPVSYTCFSIQRALINIPNDELSCDRKSLGPLTSHFLVRLQTSDGVTDIHIEPVLKIVNLLPCQLLFRLGDTAKSEKIESYEDSCRSRKRYYTNEEGEVNIGDQMKCLSVDPRLKPHISLRIPGYKWSSWNRIINRQNPSDSWHKAENEDSTYEPRIDEIDSIEEVQSVVRFEPLVENNDAITIILSTECGHFPTVKIYAQYWVLDETGFGLRISEGFEDLLNSVPDKETSRRSLIRENSMNDKRIEKDLNIPGNEWSIGRSGMTLFFSKKRFLTLCIESNAICKESFRSKWASPVDVSNPTPKTVFALDEYNGQRRFELCYSVVICPSIYTRTKLVTFFPRYQIINLLNTELLVSQDGCLNAETLIKPQSSMPFHWDDGMLPSQVRLSSRQYYPHNTNPKLSREKWTNGTIKLDTIGITSMRLPFMNDTMKPPTVAQVEVRLASKDQKAAVVVIIWNANETSNPLYVLSNKSSFTVLCNQVLNHDEDELKNDISKAKPSFNLLSFANTSNIMKGNINSNCLTQSIEISYPGCSNNSDDENETKILVHCNKLKCAYDTSSITNKGNMFVWSVPCESTCTFGFEDPNLPHVLEWTCISGKDTPLSKSNAPCSRVKVDTIGDANLLHIQRGIQVGCEIRAEHSTKIIEFFDITDESTNELFGNRSEISDYFQEKKTILHEYGKINEIEVSHESQVNECNDIMTITFKMEFPGMAISVVDNIRHSSCREILYLSLSGLAVEFAQTYDGYHELEIRLTSLQLDNYVFGSKHPVLISHPFHEEAEPYLHVSVVRRLQEHAFTFVFRYLAFRILDTEIQLDRRTAETLLIFIDPIRKIKKINSQKPDEWIKRMTMNTLHARANENNKLDIDTEQKLSIAKSRRVYLEHFHLHPIRLSLTFSQEWTDFNFSSGGVHIFQFVRSMPSLTNAPLTFTSFVVSHAFESPQALIRILGAHYLSQLVRQVFAILGSLTILNGPADLLANVGTGVRDFFYEPINGLVHGPAQFLEGLETGALSLARGVIFGVVHGAAQVTDLVTLNIAGLTDKDFIDERNAYKRSLIDAKIRGNATQTLNDSLYLAGASIARSVKSGAVGMIQQPSIYASRYGSAGFVHGVGKALVGAVLKPMVGVGDALVLVLNHVTDATSITKVGPKIPSRLRRALPQKGQTSSVQLTPYDESAAKAQKIVTDNESINDVYIGHVNISSHLIIASKKSLWVIDQTTNERTFLNWEGISHFSISEGENVKIHVFSQNGLQSHIFSVSSPHEFSKFYNLLYAQASRMGNGMNSICELDSISAVQVEQQTHNFGRFNNRRISLPSTTRDENGLISRCYARVKLQGSESSSFFKDLDEEAWALVSLWGQMFTGLSSKRCIVAGFINGTQNFLQVRSTNVVEGSSPCYRIASKEYNESQHILSPGGAIILFAWGSIPNLIHEGHVILHIETNAFVSKLFEEKSSSTFAKPLPGFQVRFLEKSYDSSGWWAKYWLLAT